MSDIYTRQNEKGNIELLKIQRIVYSKAKKIQYLFTFISLFIAVVFLVLTSIFDSKNLWTISLFIALIIFVVGIILDVWVSKLKEIAAGIQQRFDINVLGVPTSYIGLNIPNAGIVGGLCIKYKNYKLKNLENWYSNYEGYNRELQILFCQKENVSWDKPLRIWILHLIIAVISVISIVILTLGIVSNDLYLTFSLFSWLLPCFGWGIKTIKELCKDINRLKILEKELDNPLNIENDKIKKKIEEIQMLIWRHRKESFLVPNCLYDLKREKQQIYEDNIAKEVREKLIKDKEL